MSQVQVSELFYRSTSLSCSTAAQAFASLAPQPAERFQLALKHVLPVLQDTTHSKPAERILAAFILYTLYVPHSISINPFKFALIAGFETEKRAYIVSSPASANEQLVWVLWKILRGEGDDLGAYSPLLLAESRVPPVLKPNRLQVVEDEDGIRAFACSDSISVDNDAIALLNPPFGQSLTPSRPKQQQHTADLGSHTEASGYFLSVLLATLARALTLSEQRYLTPILQSFIASTPHSIESDQLQLQHEDTSSALCTITSLDLSPLVSHNPSIAHLIIIALLFAASSDPRPFPYDSLDPVATSSHAGTLNLRISAANDHLAALAALPPILQTFDVLGRLMADRTPLPDYMTPFVEVATPPPTLVVADLVKTEVLGRFITECTGWLDAIAAEDDAGLISDDRVAQGVRNLCRFYMSLARRSLVDPRSDPSAPLLEEFALRHARFEDAISLYRLLSGMPS